MSRTRRQKAAKRGNNSRRLEKRESALYQAVAHGRDFAEVQRLFWQTKKQHHRTTTNLKSLRNAAGNTLLHVAAQRAWVPVVRLLVEEGGMDPNRTGCNGWTALHAAVEYERYSPSSDVEATVTYLLEQGASLAVRDRVGGGRTPFEMANSLYHTTLSDLMLRFYAKWIFERHGRSSLLWLFKKCGMQILARVGISPPRSHLWCGGFPDSRLASAGSSTIAIRRRRQGRGGVRAYASTQKRGKWGSADSRRIAPLCRCCERHLPLAR